MKAKHDQHDKILEDFFQELKEIDLRNPVPAFDDLAFKRTKKDKHWLAWIAASVILVLSGWFFYPAEKETEMLILEMALSVEKPSTESLNTKEISMYEWESPTQSLISDF